MRILIVTTYFPPLNSIASLRPYSWAKYWSLAGHDVTVLTTAKEHIQDTDLALPLAGFIVREVALPSLFNRCKTSYLHKQRLISKPTTWKQRAAQALFSFFNRLRSKTGVFSSCRMPDFTDLWIRPALKEIQNDAAWDLVISTAGPYATHLVGAAIKKRGQAKKWIADYRDKWSDSLIYPGVFPFNRIEGIIERRILGKADVITTISKPFAEAFRIKCPDAEILAVENGFDPCDLNDIDQCSIFPENGKFRIVYTGSIYARKQDPSPLFQAIAAISLDPKRKALLDNLEIHFFGSNHGNLQELIEYFGVGHWVQMHNSVRRQDALRMQRDAHVLLFLAWNDSSVNGVMTGKLFEYLFSKTPILAICSQGLEEAQMLIMEAKAGVACANAEEISSYLTKQLHSPAIQKNQIDPNILNRYNRQFLALKLLESVSI